MPILSAPTVYVPRIKAAKEKLKRASKRNRCPLCNGTGCGVNSQIVLCWRVEAGSKERVNSGAYLHVRTDYNPFTPPPAEKMEPKASLDLIVQVYESLLDCLILSDSHIRNLEARGLTKTIIAKNRYRSTPSKLDGKIICKYLSDLYNLDGVPGFYYDESRQLNIKGSGMFIPYRDAKGVIRGMQIRPDRGNAKYFWFSSADLPKGASSGSFPHFAGVDYAKQSKEIWITEGGLKADCASFLGSIGVVAMAGVTAVDYHTLMQEIKSDVPEVEKIILAFDADWKTNIHVKKPLLQLLDVAREHFDSVEIEDWDAKQGKGIDDKLLKEKNGKNIRKS
jgi:hypothetical protein